MKKIKLIEAPREEIRLSDEAMSSLLGGLTYNCPNTYKHTFIGSDTCTNNYTSGNCGGALDASDYCRNYSSCFLKYK